MRGTFFHSPFEWQIEVTGESWNQGDSIKGSLKLKNSSQNTEKISGEIIKIGYGEIKKVQQRDFSAIKVENFFKIEEPQKINPSEERSFHFDFKLPDNCGITDSKSSFYLTCGPNGTESLLQLNIQAHKYFSEFTKLIETFHRFKLKSLKFSKGLIEYKMIPPASKEYAQVDSLTLNLNINESIIKATFNFQLKKIDTLSVTTKIKKEAKVIELVLDPKDYLMGRDMLDQDKILKQYETVFSEVKGQFY
jgi:hypothetical protein